MAGRYRKFFTDNEIKLYKLDDGGLDLFIENATDKRFQEYIDFCGTIRSKPDLFTKKFEEMKDHNSQ
jgi:hypothetical protein